MDNVQKPNDSEWNFELLNLGNLCSWARAWDCRCDLIALSYFPVAGSCRHNNWRISWLSVNAPWSKFIQINWVFSQQEYDFQLRLCPQFHLHTEENDWSIRRASVCGRNSMFHFHRDEISSWIYAIEKSVGFSASPLLIDSSFCPVFCFF
jgi:hypothetical protein